MSTTKKGNAAAKREAWGRLRKLPSGRWQARYPGPDGNSYTARTDDDQPLTFLTKTDARTWLAGIQTKIARGDWVANSRFGERQSTHRIARFRRPESMEPPGRRSVAALYSQ